MIIISKNVKLSKNDIAILSNKQLIINNVVTSHGADDAYIVIERVLSERDNNNKVN